MMWTELPINRLFIYYSLTNAYHAMDDALEGSEINVQKRNMHCIITTKCLKLFKDRISIYESFVYTIAIQEYKYNLRLS